MRHLSRTIFQKIEAKTYLDIICLRKLWTAYFLLCSFQQSANIWLNSFWMSLQIVAQQHLTNFSKERKERSFPFWFEEQGSSCNCPTCKCSQWQQVKSQAKLNMNKQFSILMHHIGGINLKMIWGRLQLSAVLNQSLKLCYLALLFLINFGAILLMQLHCNFLFLYLPVLLFYMFLNCPLYLNPVLCSYERCYTNKPALPCHHHWFLSIHYLQVVGESSKIPLSWTSRSQYTNLNPPTFHAYGWDCVLSHVHRQPWTQPAAGPRQQRNRTHPVSTCVMDSFRRWVS